ncbi:late competence development ComFB family protein [Fredinandcohnia onubensis]|nr:late competence development ComFB family protein [Fredinandcohnia onubensis]
MSRPKVFPIYVYCMMMKKENGEVHMKVFNAMEPLVAEAINDNWSEFNLPCKCEQCKNDVFALTLNNIPPRYVSKDSGMAYVRAQYFNKQMMANIYVKIAEAVNIVAKNPQCANFQRS